VSGRLLAAGLCAGAALIACHATPTERSAIPAAVLSPAGPAAQACPAIPSPGIAVATDEVIPVMHGFLPRLLPTGFGVVAQWRPTARERDAGVAWADARCKTIVLRLSPGRTGSPTGVRVADWSLVKDGQCGNGSPESVSCFRYRANTRAGLLSLSTSGMARPESDAVAASIQA